ncbi:MULTISPECIES: phage holin family protein [Gracilibacillus]|uniref:Holin n=1 Tax=Gracilibacillus dipsosauri TaxID=178340 RepID=A0A317KVM5_9BACI|nr:phage holin family protein [Gracilibacillus dipsosauri]PWU67547.1 hypothetical protein DLJ74_13865 [Gracilibacillus dipsosauri]
MLTDFRALLRDDFYFIVPALWFIGYACKRTPLIPDWLIIWILLACGIFAACHLFGWNIRSMVDGIIATGVAVFSHQLVKQTMCQDK